MANKGSSSSSKGSDTSKDGSAATQGKASGPVTTGAQATSKGSRGPMSAETNTDPDSESRAIESSLNRGRGNESPKGRVPVGQGGNHFGGQEYNDPRASSSPDTSRVTDLSVVIPHVAAGVGITDLTKAVGFYRQHKAAIDSVIAFFKGVFKRKAEATNNQSGVPSMPTVPSTPEPEPDGNVKDGKIRNVNDLRSKYTLIERKLSMTPRSGRRILSKAEFEEIVSGSVPLRVGDRVHVDNTPLDQAGVEFKPGDKANEQLLDEDGNPKITHIVSGVGELTNEYDDYGMTPVILAPWEGNEHDFDYEGELGYQAEIDGVKGNVLPTLRVKHWQD